MLTEIINIFSTTIYFFEKTIFDGFFNRLLSKVNTLKDYWNTDVVIDENYKCIGSNASKGFE